MQFTLSQQIKQFQLMKQFQPINHFQQIFNQFQQIKLFIGKSVFNLSTGLLVMFLEYAIFHSVSSILGAVRSMTFTTVYFIEGEDAKKRL